MLWKSTRYPEFAIILAHSLRCDDSILVYEDGLSGCLILFLRLFGCYGLRVTFLSCFRKGSLVPATEGGTRPYSMFSFATFTDYERQNQTLCKWNLREKLAWNFLALEIGTLTRNKWSDKILFSLFQLAKLFQLTTVKNQEGYTHILKPERSLYSQTWR